MKHYISICCERGTKCDKAVKVELCEALSALTKAENTREAKHDNFLLFPAYSSTATEYPRLEASVDRFSVIVLDCDNDKNHPDANIIDRWKEQMEGYDYLLYETASSTPECPKFRIILPLDEELEWSKNAKKAVFHRFRQLADFKASWFFSPNTPKLDTVYDHEGKREFPATVLKKDIEVLDRCDQIEELNRTLAKAKHDRWLEAHPDYTDKHDNWRKLPSVKKCLDGLHVGERDNALCAACYAMDKNGYRDRIPEFLEECAVERAFKDKWLKRYR